MKVRAPGVRKLRKMIERCNPLWAATNNLMKARTQHATSRWDDDKAWSSQEWKADKSMDDRTMQPVVTFW